MADLTAAIFEGAACGNEKSESTTQELKSASVEWPWFQKKNVRISILIPVPQVRDFIQPKYRVGRNLALYQATVCLGGIESRF